MQLGCIADDFTGASDVANTLAQGGMRTELFIGLPGVVPECAAGVVALKIRSVPAAEAVAQSLAALHWLQERGCRQFVFKYCSTFDSTPAGNIGPVAEALLDALSAPVAIVCPAFPATGRQVFQGHLFVNGRLLNESGMERHPLTPMTDPDLRRWLRLQTQGPVGAVALDVVRAGPAALAAAIEREGQAGRRLVVVDAVADDDLRTITAACAGHALITGASGVALGLPATFRNIGAGGVATARVRGPGVVLCGSCSAMSQRQVAHYLLNHPGQAIDPAALLAGQQTADTLAAWLLANLGAEPILYSTAAPDAVVAAQAHGGHEAVTTAIEACFGAVATRLVAAGVRRLVVGGGETSGAVVAALGLRRFQIGAEIAPGVPALLSEADPPMALALKSGNFGTEDFFAVALACLNVPCLARTPGLGSCDGDACCSSAD